MAKSTDLWQKNKIDQIMKEYNCSLVSQSQVFNNNLQSVELRVNDNESNLSPVKSHYNYKNEPS